jgi:hypothetical protein
MRVGQGKVGEEGSYVQKESNILGRRVVESN